MKFISVLLLLLIANPTNASVSKKCVAFLNALVDQVETTEKILIRTAVPVECQYYQAKELDAKLLARISNAYRDHRKVFNDSSKVMAVIADLNSFISPPKEDGSVNRSETAKCELEINLLRKKMARLASEVLRASSTSECNKIITTFSKDCAEVSLDCKGQIFVMTSKDFKRDFKEEIESHLSSSVDKESLTSIYAGFRSAIIKQAQEKCRKVRPN